MLRSISRIVSKGDIEIDIATACGMLIPTII